jgi:hypothetical protein
MQEEKCSYSLQEKTGFLHLYFVVDFGALVVLVDFEALVVLVDFEELFVLETLSNQIFLAVFEWGRFGSVRTVQRLPHKKDLKFLNPHKNSFIFSMYNSSLCLQS